ncbi:MAG TPA: ABC transporter ATP-binding protein [Burkholderiales bacterium]|nr:ABC transporter ATP-binding protein [Burkholderiales bacterium]
MSAALQVAGLGLRLEGIRLADIDLSVDRGECLVILGPNGAGKSVLLDAIAGFQRLSSGRLTLNGQDITALAPERRRIAFMFQDFALFPHLTVAENVRFGATVAGKRRAGEHDADVRTEKLMQRFGIAPLRARLPYFLSGGEKQRVALARAFATQPALLLLDEPSSALDARARDQLHEELRALLADTGVPMIYVTHDRSEALTLADRLAVMRNGRLVQQGRPDEVFERPANAFVAEFVGMETMLRGRARALGDGLAQVACGPFNIYARVGGALPVGEVIACVRPENIRLVPPSTAVADVNQFAATVEALLDRGPYLRVRLGLQGQRLIAFVPKHEPALRGLHAGDPAHAAIAPEHVHLIEADAAD